MASPLPRKPLKIQNQGTRSEFNPNTGVGFDPNSMSGGIAPRTSSSPVSAKFQAAGGNNVQNLTGNYLGTPPPADFNQVWKGGSTVRPGPPNPSFAPGLVGGGTNKPTLNQPNPRPGDIDSLNPDYGPDQGRPGVRGLVDQFTGGVVRPGVNEFLDRPREGAETIADIIGRDTPIPDALQEKFGDPFDNYIDDLTGAQGTANEQLNEARGALDKDVVGGLQNSMMGTQVQKEFGDLKGKSEADVLDDYFKQSSFDTGRSDTAHDTLAGVQGTDASQIGSDVTNILSQLQGQVGKSGINTQVEDMLSGAMGGNLTAADSEFLKQSQAARQPALEDALRQAKIAAGQQRGIGGGRFQKEIGDITNRFNQQSLADIADVQKRYADIAPDFATAQRGQDVTMAGQAAGLGGTAQQLATQAAGQAGNLNLGEGQLNLRQKELQAAEDARKFQQQQDLLNQTQEQQQWEEQFGLNSQLGKSGALAGLAGQGFDQSIDLGNLLQQNKATDAATPGMLQGLVGGLGNLAVGAGAAGFGFPKISKLFGG